MIGRYSALELFSTTVYVLLGLKIRSTPIIGLEFPAGMSKLRQEWNWDSNTVLPLDCSFR